MTVSARPPPEAITKREARKLGLPQFLSMSICRRAGCNTFVRVTSSLACVACLGRDAPKREAQRLKAEKKAAEERAKARARAAAVKKREAEQAQKEALKAAQKAATAKAREGKRRKEQAAQRKAEKQAQREAEKGLEAVPAVQVDDLDEVDDLDLPPWASSGPPMRATGVNLDAPPWA